MELWLKWKMIVKLFVAVDPYNTNKSVTMWIRNCNVSSKSLLQYYIAACRNKRPSRNKKRKKKKPGEFHSSTSVFGHFSRVSWGTNHCDQRCPARVFNWWNRVVLALVQFPRIKSGMYKWRGDNHLTSKWKPATKRASINPDAGRGQYYAVRGFISPSLFYSYIHIFLAPLFIYLFIFFQTLLAKP